MRLRALHLAGILLLLASLSGTEGSAQRLGDYTVGGHYIGVLLAHDQSANPTEAALSLRTRDASLRNLPTAQLSHHRAPWTMRPAAAQAISLQAVTGSGL